MSGTTNNVGSQVATSLQGTMDSASIARLVQQLMSLQNTGTGSSTGTNQTGTGTAGTTGVAGTGLQNTGTVGSTGTTGTSNLSTTDYATMMQQLLSLLYGRSGLSGGQSNGTGGSGGGGLESGGGSTSG